VRLGSRSSLAVEAFLPLLAFLRAGGIRALAPRPAARAQSGSFGGRIDGERVRVRIGHGRHFESSPSIETQGVGTTTFALDSYGPRGDKVRSLQTHQRALMNQSLRSGIVRTSPAGLSGVGG
jgi:hypothetical protein